MIEIRDVQSDILELMLEIDHICRKHNIKYYLSGGTLLGALRHEGFIPWDDDIDINMTRDDYIKFESVIDDELKPDRDLVCSSRYSGYTSPIPRYTKLDSTNLVRGRAADECPHGLFVDIIILDPMPTSPERILDWKKKHYVYCELIEYPYIIASRRCDWDGIDVEMYRQAKKASETRGKKAVLDEIAAEIFSVSEKDAEYYCMRFGTIWLGIMPIDWFGEPIEVSFEGHKFFAPRKPIEQMWLFYGAGWKYIIPRKTKHVFFTIPSLDNGNCEREFFSIVDRADFRSTIEEYNELCLDYHVELHNRLYETARPYLRLIHYRINRLLKNNRIEDLLEDADRCYDEVFKEFVALQLIPQFVSNKVALPLPADQLSFMLEILIRSVHVSAAKIITELNENRLNEIPGLSDLFERINNLNELALAHDKNDIDTMREYYLKLEEKDIQSKIAVCTKLILIRQETITDDSIQYARKSVEDYEEDGEVIKLAADVIRESGRIEEASELYSIAASLTKNGLMLLDMRSLGVEEAIEFFDDLYSEDDDEKDNGSSGRGRDN